MDELVCPASSCSSPSPSPAPFFSTAGHLLNHEFVSCDVQNHWMGADDWLDEPLDLDAVPWDTDNGSRSASTGNDDLSGQPPPPAPKKRRGRKPGPRTNDGPVISHVEAERQRRDKLNRRFCELRAAVPTVSRMDKASLLADATTYIAELRHRVQQLEAEAKQQASSVSMLAATPVLGGHEDKLEVQMLVRDAAALRLTSAARHAPARFMLALRSLDLPVQHACVCRVDGVTVQDAVVDVPAGAGLRDERGLRTALLHRLQRSG